MRRNILTMGIAAMTLVLTAACGSDNAPTVGGAATTAPAASATAPTSSSAPSAASSASAPSTSSTSSAADKTFPVGQCLGDRPSYTPVDCTTPHPFEVAGTVQSSEHAGDLIKRGKLRENACDRIGAAYLGSEALAISRIAVAALPTVADPKNSERIVCIVSELNPSLKGHAPHTTTLKGSIAGTAVANYGICLKGRASDDKVEIVPCSQPHMSQGIGGRIQAKPSDPGDKAVAAAALKFCQPIGHTFLGTKTRRDVIPSQNSGPELTGCFVEVTSGTVTKSLAGIGSKPLSAYR